MPSKPPFRAPSDLSPATRQWVERVCRAYELEEHHFKLLVAAGEAWDARQEARRALRKHGRVFVDRFGQPRSRPEVAHERDAGIAFARLLRELALDVNLPDDSRPPHIGGR